MAARGLPSVSLSAAPLFHDVLILTPIIMMDQADVEEVRGGYHPPSSSVRGVGYFNAEAILRFADNYCPFTEGMYLHVANLDFTNSWVEIVGRAIGGSEHLRMLQLLDDDDEPANNSSLFFNLIAPTGRLSI